MKASIQLYGILITFTFFIFLFPQLIGIAALYRQCNSIASYLTEIVEIHEGIQADNGANEMISNTLSKYPSLVCSIDKEPVNKFYIYAIQCKKKVLLSILNIPVDVKVSKKTRRVIY